jgi:hypothetical protein
MEAGCEKAGAQAQGTTTKSNKVERAGNGGCEKAGAKAGAQAQEPPLTCFHVETM